MVGIRQWLSLSKLMQTLPLHSLLQRGSMSLQAVFMHWTIIVPTVCLEHKLCKDHQQELVQLQENIHYVKLCRYSQKYACPTLNGHEDTDMRTMWSSGGSTNCSCLVSCVICTLCRSVLQLLMKPSHVAECVLGKILQTLRAIFMKLMHVLVT